MQSSFQLKNVNMSGMNVSFFEASDSSVVISNAKTNSSTMSNNIDMIVMDSSSLNIISSNFDKLDVQSMYAIIVERNSKLTISNSSITGYKTTLIKSTDS